MYSRTTARRTAVLRSSSIRTPLAIDDTECQRAGEGCSACQAVASSTDSCTLMTLSRPLISKVRRRLALGHATRRSASRRRARVRPSTSTRRPAESMKRTPVRSMTIEDDPSSTTRLSWSRNVGTAAMSISPCAANTVWSPSFAIWKLASMAGTLAALLVQAQGGDERFLGDLHPADVLHPALALFLALEEFALAA